MSRYDFSSGAGFPLGTKRLALLRRVHAAGGNYHCQRNADHEQSDSLVAIGVLTRDRRKEDVLLITEMGRAYLDQLARAA